MTQIWSDSILTTLAQQAEETIAMELPCIISRISIKAIKDQAIVNLPDYVLDIISVTWKGYPLDPFPMASYIEAGSGPGTITSGQPRYYLYSGYGTRALKLIPMPNETLDIATIPLVTKSEIKKRLVFECRRLPDVTGTSHRIPEYFRRRLVKEYVCTRAFLQEGNGQNLGASLYYKQKFELILNLVRQIYNGIFVAKRYEMLPQMTHMTMGGIGRPVLPSQFGRVID